MMSDFFNFFFETLNLFDIFFLIIMIYYIIQCFSKGFSLSFISFLKWVVSVIITIIITPKLHPWVSEYVESDLSIFGLELLFVFIVSLYLII